MKILKLFSIIVLSGILLTVTVFGQSSLKIKSNHIKFINGVYRVPADKVEGKTIWIVDGLLIRREIYPEFLYGGNEERYPFIPEGEIWIDNAISADEFKYTLAHEIHERNLMARKGLSYSDAHDSSLALEQHMRIADLNKSKIHESSLRMVSPTDCDNVKEIEAVPDSIQLKNIYRVFIVKRDSIDIWIVDGAAVRRDIFPDFGLSGNDLAYKFIPPKEIWIDAQISCEETEFSIISELTERKLMAKGISYDSAYLEALKIVAQKRNLANKSATTHKSLAIPKILERDIGTGSESNN